MVDSGLHPPSTDAREIIGYQTSMEPHQGLCSYPLGGKKWKRYLPTLSSLMDIPFPVSRDVIGLPPCFSWH